MYNLCLSQFKMNKSQIYLIVTLLIIVEQGARGKQLESTESNAKGGIDTNGDRHPLSDIDRRSEIGGNYVLTTPKIDVTTEKLSRFEQGLEDYEEAVARVEKIKEGRRIASNTLGQIASALSMFSILNTAWNKVSSESRDIKNSTHTLFNNGNDYNPFAQKHISKRDGMNKSTEIEEGRYIKGDPLKGYYDFVITEGSYKFWAAFQLFTAALMIYSTFAAIYYSKVNPIQSDYDYVSYLGGRSMADDPEPESSDGATSRLSDLLNTQWWQSAAHGFEFVLDAIDRLPES